MSMSQFAGNLKCYCCSKPNKTAQWPVNGDRVPFYYQSEPGNHTLTITCPHCGKDWYIVWDDNPGPMEPLLLTFG